MMKKIFLLLIVFAFMGCATAQVEQLSPNLHAKPILSDGSKIFLARPENGTYDQYIYYDSGKNVQNAFYESLLHYTNEVFLGDTVMTWQDALQQATAKRADILIYPKIVQWEDRNTMWSGKRDKVKIIVTVYSIPEGKTVDNATLRATNSWFTFINARPENRLKTIVPPYVKSLYAF